MDNIRSRRNRSTVIRRSRVVGKDAAGNQRYPEVTNLHTAMLRLTKLTSNKPQHYMKDHIIIERSSSNIFIATPAMSLYTVQYYIKKLHENRQKGIKDSSISCKLNKIADKYPSIEDNIRCPFCNAVGTGIKLKTVADDFEFMTTSSTRTNRVTETAVEYSLKTYVQCGYCGAQGPKISKRIYHSFTQQPIPDKLQRIEQRVKEFYKSSYSKAVTTWVRLMPEEK